MTREEAAAFLLEHHGPWFGRPPTVPELLGNVWLAREASAKVCAQFYTLGAAPELVRRLNEANAALFHKPDGTQKAQDIQLELAL